MREEDEMMKKYGTAIALMVMAVMLLSAGCTPEEQPETSAAATVNDFASVLASVKTTQAFTGDPVSDDDLTAILNAGINAPSAMNSQPWHFSVITDGELLGEIASSMSMGTPKDMKEPDNASEGSEDTEKDGKPAAPAAGTKKLSLADATVAIVVSASSNMSTDSFDCGLACDRMSVAAIYLGYGTKIVSSPAEAINSRYRDKLGIPENMDAVAVLLIGVEDTSNDAVSSATVRNSFEDTVTYVK